MLVRRAAQTWQVEEVALPLKTSLGCLTLSISTLLTLAAPTLTGSPQSCEPRCNPGAAQYYEVLDAIFPRVQPQNPWPENPYIVLRYTPLDELEFQIVIAMKNDGAFELYRYSLPKGSNRVADQVSELRAAHPTDPPKKLAEYIKVEHKLIRVDPKILSGLMNSFAALRIPAELDSSAILDASGYEFWYMASPGCNILHISIADLHYGHDTKAHPLVRWMNRVRSAVEGAHAQQ